jgi:hypothetical protein
VSKKPLLIHPLAPAGLYDVPANCESPEMYLRLARGLYRIHTDPRFSAWVARARLGGVL